MSSAVTGYKMTLGADAPPCAYEDIAAADLLFIAGSNTAWAHPVLFRRIEDAKKANPDMKIIVVDPRRTDTAEAADLFLPILPGTDIALYNAMLHVMLWEGLVDADYVAARTEGFEVLKSIVRDYTPAMAAEICGVPADDIVKAAQWFGERGAATLSLYCQGLNQSSHGSHNNAALIHLHLASGKIGRPGCGPFSLTGQPNAMGGREAGGMATLLPGHRELANAAHRAEIAELWGVDGVPEQPGLAAVELFEAVHAGKIKALWIACTNPAQSLPDAEKVKEALARCDFVVVQEAYADTDTTEFADLLLPAASWGEKEGTVTNSERRISRVRAAVAAPGEARADWDIAADFARRLGTALGKGAQAAAMFPYARPEQVFIDHVETTRGRDLDITGLSYARLENQGPQQWPCPQGAPGGTTRLYGDGVFPTPSGRACFVAVKHQATAEAIDARHPLRLTTGRLRDQWHGMSRTGSVARLYAHEPEPVIEMNAKDMERRQIKDGDLVRAKSRRGAVVLRVRASDTLRTGQAFIAMHWGRRFMDSAGANALTIAAVDPYSKQPELKHAAIQVEKVAVPWRLSLLRRAGDAVLMRALQPWLSRFTHAMLTLAGRDAPVVVLNAWGEPLPAADLVELDRLLGLDDPMTLRFDDAKRDIHKRALIADGSLVAARLAGETAAAGWLKEAMAGSTPLEPVRRWLLAPLGMPPAGGGSRGRIVCNCFDVSEAEILGDYRAGLDLAALQQKRQCGTSCGSCLPELRRLEGLAKQAA
jgi:assimilatory nitrate reductase catalytic subunit